MKVGIIGCAVQMGPGFVTVCVKRRKAHLIPDILVITVLHECIPLKKARHQHLNEELPAGLKREINKDKKQD